MWQAGHQRFFKLANGFITRVAAFTPDEAFKRAVVYTPAMAE